MGTDKRERQKANRQAKLEAERKVEDRQNLRSRLISGLVIFGIVVVGIGLLWFAGQGGDDEIEASDTVGNEFEPQEITTTIPPVELAAPAPGGAIEGATECPAEDGSSERITNFAEAPPMCIDEDTTYIAEVATTRGTFTVEMDASVAPNTVNNFVVLARYHFYDGVPFHRIIPGFVVQGGDAVGEPLGTGNPGYEFEDESPEAGDYQIGSVAMANSGPNTNGSQFFVVTGDQGVALPPLYSLFGTVTDGLDIVSEIEETGSQATGAPTEETIIESVTITEK